MCARTSRPRDPDRTGLDHRALDGQDQSDQGHGVGWFERTSKVSKIRNVWLSAAAGVGAIFRNALFSAISRPAEFALLSVVLMANVCPCTVNFVHDGPALGAEGIPVKDACAPALPAMISAAAAVAILVNIFSHSCLGC